MKSLLPIFLLLLLAIGLQAAHIVGGEITYECLGPVNNDPQLMRYRFTMSVYRDCFGGGADFDSPNGQVRAHITIYQGSDRSPYDIVNLGRPAIANLEVNLSSNPCIIVPANVCVQEGVYTFELELPVIDESYYIVYQRCCRNNTISNLADPGGTGSTYSVEITALAQEVCNSSPTFNNFPPLVICSGEPLNFDHSATDPEGDELFYSFCAPLTGGTRNRVAPNPDSPPPWDPVNYVGTFTGANPLGGSPRVRINTNSGLITGSPEFQGQFVVGVCVQEFRNGQLLSELRRDFQFNITFCEPQVRAALDAAANNKNYYYQTCDENTVTIINQSTREQFIDEYLWTMDMGTFGIQTFDTRNVTLTFPGPGNYTGTMVLNPGSDADCSDTAYVEVDIIPPLFVDFRSDYDTCVAGPVDFVDQTIGSGPPVISWEWDFGDGNTSSEPSPRHQYIDPGTYRVRLTVADTFGCNATIIKDINWFPVPPLIVIDPSAEEGCPPIDVVFTNLSTPIDETYQIDWDFGDGNTGSGISPAHLYETTGSFSVQVDITSPIGCFTSEFFPDLIEVDSPPVADFAYEPQIGLSNFDSYVRFEDRSRRAIRWEWSFGGLGGSPLQNPDFTFPDTGQQVVQLVVEHFFGCVDSITRIVDIEPQIRFFMPNAFSPNGDNKNELFMGGGFFRGIRDYQMRVFNRYGEMIFESDDPLEGWNGGKNNSGPVAPGGIYMYHITFTGPRGQPHDYRGYATLVK